MEYKKNENSVELIISSPLNDQKCEEGESLSSSVREESFYLLRYIVFCNFGY